MIRRVLSKVIQFYRRTKLTSVGQFVNVQRGCHLQGEIHVGNHVLIGSGAYFVSTRAKLMIHDYVIFGPNVTIYTGDHALDFVGFHIAEVTDKMKSERKKQYDKDVIIEAGCWIGTRVIILKGVTIGRGSVIGAGAIVTKDVPPYSIYTGSGSTAVIRSRFSDEQIIAHETELERRGISIY